MKRLVGCLCFFLFIASFAGCSLSHSPDLESINKLYNSNKEVIDTVVDFMVNAEYDTMIISNLDISDSEGTPTMSADFQIVDIADPNVQNAVDYLINNDIVIQFYKSDGDIELLIWGERGVRCYIARSFESAVPSVQYATEIISMDEEGWYFVIADYNIWRGRQD